MAFGNAWAGAGPGARDEVPRPLTRDEVAELRASWMRRTSGCWRPRAPIESPSTRAKHAEPGDPPGRTNPAIWAGWSTGMASCTRRNTAGNSTLCSARGPDLRRFHHRLQSQSARSPRLTRQIVGSACRAIHQPRPRFSWPLVEPRGALAWAHFGMRPQPRVHPPPGAGYAKLCAVDQQRVVRRGHSRESIRLVAQKP